MKNVARFRFLTILFVFAMGTFTCKKTYDPFTVDGEALFPIENGKSRVYSVIDTNYNNSTTGIFTASQYFRKEEINGSETDLMGRTIQKLYIYQSPDSIDTLGNRIWLFDFSELWTLYRGEQYAERIEGNTRILALKFPVFEDLTWNSNLFNNDPEKIFSYGNTDTTLTLNGTEYPHCVFVLETPNRKSGTKGGVIYIEEHAWEIYAPGIGKVARYFKYYHEEGGVPKPESRILIEQLYSFN